MIKVFKYNISDDVCVQPYTIFENPTPIGWNDNPYRFGKEYIQNDHFKFNQSIDIYAQYNPTYIHYFEVDLTSNVQHVIYENRTGAYIEIAQSLTYNPNFVCWNTPDNEILSSGQYISLTHDISACISCEYTYQLQFNPNGEQGYMDSISGLTQLWVDTIDFSKRISHFMVSLPSSDFVSSSNKTFLGWTIHNMIYQPGEIIELSSDIVAYATWVNPITYTLNGYARCVNTATIFRYMMVNIVQSINNEHGFAIQRLQLINDQNEAYIIPLNTTVSGSFVDDQQKDNALNLIKTQNTDFIISSDVFPYSIIYDFQIQRLNIKKYNKWYWYTASQLSNNVEQNIKWIQLLFSNDGIHWFMGSDIYDKNEKLPQTNNTLSYESTILSVDYCQYDFMYDEPNPIYNDDSNDDDSNDDDDDDDSNDDNGDDDDGDDDESIIPDKNKDQYICFTCIENGVCITMQADKNAPPISLETSIDDCITWTPYNIGEEIILSYVGDKVYFRASKSNKKLSNGIGKSNKFCTVQYRTTYDGTSNNVYNGKCEVTGNILSLLNKNKLKSTTQLNTYSFTQLFENCFAITTAPQLPSKNIDNHCYERMFAGCINLKSAPTLPAKTIAKSCYAEMFARCEKLKSAPSLPATKLADRCYFGMFSGCTNLKHAPILKASKLTPDCYGNMFQECRNLSELKVNFTSWPSTRQGHNSTAYVTSTAYWLGGVNESGRFICPIDLVIPPDDERAIFDFNSIPKKWKIEKQ